VCKTVLTGGWVRLKGNGDEKEGGLHLVYYLRGESINTRGDERRRKKEGEGEGATGK
jgi:hypothetical protein